MFGDTHPEKMLKLSTMLEERDAYLRRQAKDATRGTRGRCELELTSLKALDRRPLSEHEWNARTMVARKLEFDAHSVLSADAIIDLRDILEGLPSDFDFTAGIGDSVSVPRGSAYYHFGEMALLHLSADRRIEGVYVNEIVDPTSGTEFVFVCNTPLPVTAYSLSQAEMLESFTAMASVFVPDGLAAEDLLIDKSRYRGDRRVISNRVLHSAANVCMFSLAHRNAPFGRLKDFRPPKRG